MVKRVPLLIACLLIASPVLAGPIITWQAFGEVGSSHYSFQQNTGRVPEIGTPYQLTLSFDLATLAQTPLSPAGSNCNWVSPVAASMTLGAYTFTGPGAGFTHATLPGSNCTPSSPDTMFVVRLQPPPGNPWSALNSALMELWYTDQFVRDTFPTTPIGNGGFQIRDAFGGSFFSVSGSVEFPGAGDPEQPSPVPEPATLTLFGLGLAAVARRVRRSRA